MSNSPTKHVLVTGASRGIGLAIKEKFLAAGYHVTNLDKISDDKDTIVCDLENGQQVTDAFAQVQSKFGLPDCLINNAGIYLAKPWDALTTSDFDQTIAINSRAQFLLSQNFARALITKDKPGNIVNISSICGQVGSRDIAYAASKGAILAMTKSFAKELAPHNIRVNAVAPGLIETDMAADIPADRLQSYKSKIAMNRLGSADEVAQAAFFLASDEASYITGTILNVDGGLF